MYKKLILFLVLLLNSYYATAMTNNKEHWDSLTEGLSGFMSSSKIFNSELDSFLTKKKLPQSTTEITITKEDMPKFFEKFEKLLLKWKVEKSSVSVTLIFNSMNAEFEYRPGINSGLRIGDQIFREFADEEIEFAISHEIAHFKKNHAGVQNMALTVCCVAIANCFGLLELENWTKLSSSIPGVSLVWWIFLLHSKRYAMMPGIALMSKYSEIEADKLAMLTADRADLEAIISFHTRLYFIENKLVDKLEPTIKENLEFILKKEKWLVPAIENIKTCFKTHPSTYFRLHETCDLHKQIIDDRKTRSTRHYEKYKWTSKWKEWLECLRCCRDRGDY